MNLNIDVFWQFVWKTIEIAADIVGIIIGSIGIYLFYKERGNIKKVFNSILNYATNSSIVDLRFKLRQLNELNLTDPEQNAQAEELLSDILGQLKGNKTLNTNCTEIIQIITSIIDDYKQFGQPQKRLIVSQINEVLLDTEITLNHN